MNRLGERDGDVHWNRMIAEAQVTVRNVGLLLAQQGIHVLSGLLFAALVPRLMGPNLYGQYALITSLSLWFVLFSSLGFTHIISRYIPQFLLQRDREDLQKFFGNLLVVRLMSGTLATSLFLLLTIFWLQEFDFLILGIVASTILVQAVARLFFILFLGLNQAARWGMGEVVHRWVLLAFLLPGFSLGGLHGACLALLLTELVVLSLGMWWARSYLSWSGLRLNLSHLAPYLRFGLTFFASGLLLTAFQYSGEVLVRAVYSDYVQVGYFRLSYDVYLTAAVTLSQFPLVFAPLLTTLLTRGQSETLRQWIERLLKVMTVGGVLIVFGVLLLGEDLVPLVLGATYRPVAANLLPLTITLLLLALSSVAHLLAVIYEKPGVALKASGIRLVAFWGCGLPLVSWGGSLGGCVAVLIASALYAGYLTRRMRRVMYYSLQWWSFAIGLGVLFLPLVWLRSSWSMNVALYGVFVVGYASTLFCLRVITFSEVTAAWQAISLRNRLLQPAGLGSS